MIMNIITNIMIVLIIIMVIIAVIKMIMVIITQYKILTTVTIINCFHNIDFIIQLQL